MPCRGGGIPRSSEEILLGDKAREGGLFGALTAPLMPRGGCMDAGEVGKPAIGGSCGTGGGGGWFFPGCTGRYLRIVRNEIAEWTYVVLLDRYIL